MKILVVNDDGVEAAGICRLARAAQTFGEVWVAAPDRQCSAMSHCITVRGEIHVKPFPFPVAGVSAYSVGGTPADCVKAALLHLLPEKPDIVLSGINFGYNVGLDILYSGTVGAAMEARIAGIPAIAFSAEPNGVFDAVDAYLLPIMKELLEKELPPDRIWNVNFPGCTRAELKGILRDRVPAPGQFYLDHYEKKPHPDGGFILKDAGYPSDSAPIGTDTRAVLDRCISIGTIGNTILRDNLG